MEVLSENSGIPKLSLRTESKPSAPEALSIGPNIETVEAKGEDESSLIEKLSSDLDYREREQAAFDKLVGSVSRGIHQIAPDKNLHIGILEYKKEPVRSISFAAPQLHLPKDGTSVVPVDEKKQEPVAGLSPQPMPRKKTV